MTPPLHVLLAASIGGGADAPEAEVNYIAGIANAEPAGL